MSTTASLVGTGVTREVGMWKGEQGTNVKCAASATSIGNESCQLWACLWLLWHGPIPQYL